MNPIFIIGYMGTGKTTFGRALAKATGLEFIDLDFYIEQRFHRSIKEIFREKGESEFRRVEANLLREAGEFSNIVIACGGGTPCFGGNMGYMNSRGLTIQLYADTERLIERYRLRPGKRPLLDGMDDDELRSFIKEHLEKRQPYYEMANIKVESSKLENRREIDSTVCAFLNRPDIKKLIYPLT